jgi:hypothetical protein
VPQISKRLKNMNMRLPVVLLSVAGLGIGYTAPANAIGCFSGGLAGAVAGHMAHHGVLGAIGGCVAGHEYHKHQKKAAAQQESNTAPVTQPNQADRPGGPQSNSQ